ncbi:hypothetical protein P7C73_g4431, partial [Tremellales sp. Uapishka_1]
GRVGEMVLGDGDRCVELNVGGETPGWVRGSVLVGADGPNSPVRKFSHIESYGHGYPTHAVVATLNHAENLLQPNDTAYQRFLSTGPMAFLPLSATASTLVWSTTPELAAAYKKLSPEGLAVMVNAGYTLEEDDLSKLNTRLLAALAESTVPTVQDLNAFIIASTTSASSSSVVPDQIIPYTITSIPARSIASFPLRLSHADRYIGSRTVLVGDAAHTIHPLAGQGLNMGLADVRSLADVWDETSLHGGDLGSYTALSQYPKKRYLANHVMLSTTDKLNMVFGNRSGIVNWVRGTGLEILNEMGPIKKILMNGAGASVGAGQKAPGWPNAVAGGLEGWLQFKGVAGMAGSIIGQAAQNGFKRAAEVLQKK